MTFDWSKLSEKEAKDSYDYLLANPYDCDDCGDLYNKDDLIRHFDTGHRVCRNCIDLYHKLYGKK